MRYQLVLQWPAADSQDYDAMIEIEDTLIQRLSAVHEVDGHDAGSGEMNIFIRTDDPQRAFAEIQGILDSRDFWVDARAAYREVRGGKYVVLWPSNLTDFGVA